MVSSDIRTFFLGYVVFVEAPSNIAIDYFRDNFFSKRKKHYVVLMVTFAPFFQLT